MLFSEKHDGSELVIVGFKADVAKAKLSILKKLQDQGEEKVSLVYILTYILCFFASTLVEGDYSNGFIRQSARQ